MASSEPATMPRGSLASDTIVLRSFGYGDWHYGRASPSAANLESAPRVNGSADENTTVLKSIGYMDWQDGRALAVVDDGDDGVRLVPEGELLDDNRFEVVKVNSEAVEVAELPITRPNLPGDPNIQPSSPHRTTGHVSLPNRLKEPTGAMMEARLAPVEDQFSSPSDRSASVPDETSVADPSFAMRGRGGACLDLRSLLMAPTASPGRWSTSGLNLYFPQGTNLAAQKGVSTGCAGAFEHSP